MDGKSFVIGILIGIAVGAVSSIAFIRVLPSSQSSYTKLTVLQDTWTSITIEGNEYVFRFSPQTSSIDLSNGQTQLYPSLSATQGAKYEWRGVEIIVSEVHSDYIVLLVKPL